MQNMQESILSTAGDEWSWKCPLNGEVEMMIVFYVVPVARRFIKHIDDNRTLGEIVETILSAYNPAPPAEEAWKVCRYAMEVHIRQDLLLLRHKTVPPVFL